MLHKVILLAVLFSVVVSSVVQAQEEATAPVLPSKTITAGSALYGEGELLMRRGRKFERAAELFAQAAEKEPSNPAYPLAMGCAYTNRVASLAHAAAFTKMHADKVSEYPGQLAEWQEAQKEPGSYLYDTERPEPPSTRIYPIKDDGVLYRLTPEHLTARLSDLCGKAQAAFDKGVGLAKTPEEQAYAEYVRGWGRYLLRTYVASGGGKVDQDPPSKSEEITPVDADDAPSHEAEDVPLDVKNVPTRKEINAAFERATELSPETAIYWEGGAAVIEDEDKQKQWIRQALELAPKNAALWYRLFNVEAGSTVALKDPKQRQIALDCLDNMAKYDTVNALPRYLRAYVVSTDTVVHGGLVGGGTGLRLSDERKKKVAARFQEPILRASFHEALTLIESGNALPRFVSAPYLPPVPRLLLPAWNYERAELTFQTWTTQVRELSHRLIVYSYLAAEEKPNSDEAIRAVRALRGIGAKLAGDEPREKKAQIWDDFLPFMVGRAITSMGYAAERNLYSLEGNREGANAAQAEYEVLQKRSSEYTSALLKSFEDDDGY